MGDAVEKGEIQGTIDNWTLTFGLWGVIEGALYIHKRGYLDPVGVNLEDLLSAQLRILEEGMKRG